ncbi:MAG: TonB-dependent receptor [Bacteroidota bacterium]
MKNLFTCLFLLGVLTIGLKAQGTIRGKVTDGDLGEPLIGAICKLQAGDQVVGGAYSDLEGAYTIKAKAGSYTLIISYLSYLDDTLSITLGDGEVVFNESLLLPETSANNDLEVVIEAKRDQASTVTLFNQKRNNLNAIDGVSTDLIKRTGDADVAAAMQRITGVTVEGGKYVYVRGLGDRYSKTMLNGAEIPGLDPNRNTVQMDIFPSNLIDNVIVYKTFSPDLPGSFTGGLVDVRTKDFPEKFQMSVSASLGFNTQASLIDDFISYETGGTDFLGFDDGTRAIPDFIQNELGNVIPDQTFTNEERANQIDQASKSFDTGLDPTQNNSTFLDQNYQVSFGNQHLLGDKTFGYIASLSYRNTYDYYGPGLDNGSGFRGNWQNTGSTANPATALLAERQLNVTNGQQNVLWGAMSKLSYKGKKTKLGLMYMHNQSGVTETQLAQGFIFSDDPNLQYESRILSYLERSLDILQLDGKHQFGDLAFDWIASGSLAGVNTPDLRFFNNDFVEGPDGSRNYGFQLNLYAAPFRFFRDMQENQYDVKANFELPITMGEDRKGKIRFGGAANGKFRDFEEIRYEYALGNLAPQYNGNPEEFFSDQNLGVLGRDANGVFNYGIFLRDASQARNNYTGFQIINAGYAMAEIPVSNRLRLIGGARLETTTMETESEDIRVDKGEINEVDVLPAASAIFAVNDKMNVRFNYSRTLARPAFREFAPFTYDDFATNIQEICNPELQRTLIDNLDLRWEWFPTTEELFSVSLFYKNFTDPIERIQSVVAANLQFSYQNVASAFIYGAEFELRKNFSFISESLRYLQIGGNLTLLQSEVDQPTQILEVGQRQNPEFETERQLQGQSPFAANVELAYVNPLNGWSASVSYNVFGERIYSVSLREPNIYEQPRPLLNTSISKRIGERFSVRVRANNLFNPEYKFIQTYRGQEFLFQRYTVGRSFSLGVTYSIR